MIVEPSQAIIRPTRDGSHVQAIPQGTIGRQKRRGGRRQLVFCPGLFFKIGRTGPERAMVARECAAARAVAAHPFWKDVPARVYRIPSLGFVARRGRPAAPDDFDALVELVETLFGAALAYPAADTVDSLRGRPLFGHLDRRERSALVAAASGLRLPRTSMHGDVHVFNFVFVGSRPRLVDWEFFDPEGSFVFDYLDFFISVSAINTDDPWHAIMRRLRTSHPALVAVADRLRLAPRALLAYYLFLKTDTVLSLSGAFRRGDEQFFNDHLAGLRLALGITEPTPRPWSP